MVNLRSNKVLGGPWASSLRQNSTSLITVCKASSGKGMCAQGADKHLLNRNTHHVEIVICTLYNFLLHKKCHDFSENEYNPKIPTLPFGYRKSVLLSMRSLAPWGGTA